MQVSVLPDRNFALEELTCESKSGTAEQVSCFALFFFFCVLVYFSTLGTLLSQLSGSMGSVMDAKWSLNEVLWLLFNRRISKRGNKGVYCGKCVRQYCSCLGRCDGAGETHFHRTHWKR